MVEHREDHYTFLKLDLNRGGEDGSEKGRQNSLPRLDNHTTRLRGKCQGYFAFLRFSFLDQHIEYHVTLGNAYAG